MNIRSKTFIVVFLTFIGLVAVLYIYSYHFILSGYLDIERRETEENIYRATEVIYRIEKNLNHMSRDLAGSYETYEFVEKPNKKFIDNNLSDSDFKNVFEVSYVAFFNKDGKLVYQKAFDLERNCEVPIKSDFAEFIIKNKFLYDHKNLDSSITGLILVPDGPMVISSVPLTKGPSSRTPNGTVIMGVFLTKRHLARLSDGMNLNINVIPVLKHRIPESYKSVVSKILSGHSYLVVPVSENLVEGYTLMRDVRNQPIILLQIQTSRALYDQGLKSVDFLFVTLIYTSLFFSFIVMYVFEKMLVYRITDLNKEVQSVGVTSDLSRRVEVKGNDEVGTLGNQINNMLNRLEISLYNLQRSEEKNRTLIENLNLGVFRIAGDEEGRFIQINPALAKIFGYDSMFEFLDANLFPYYRDPVERMVFRKLLEEKGALRDRMAHLAKKDGSMIWVSCNAKAKFDDNGNICWIDGVIEDITSKKTMEQDLIARNQELGDFTYRVSHDLKAPLDIMKGYLLVAKQNAALFEKYFEKVIGQANELTGMIENLLQLSRAGRIIGEKKDIDLINLIRRVFVILKPKEINAELNIQSEKTSFYCDPKGMEIVFTSLLQNAFECRDLEKDSLNLLFKYSVTEKESVLSLTDNGRGIKGEHLQEVFRAGFSYGKLRGSGFGLAIVSKIVSAHGGSVEVESEGENMGTTFILRLPLDEK